MFLVYMYVDAFISARTVWRATHMFFYVYIYVDTLIRARTVCRATNQGTNFQKCPIPQQKSRISPQRRYSALLRNFGTFENECLVVGSVAKGQVTRERENGCVCVCVCVCVCIHICIHTYIAAAKG